MTVSSLPRPSAAWMKLLAWSAAEGLDSPTLPQAKAIDYYEALTRHCRLVAMLIQASSVQFSLRDATTGTFRKIRSYGGP